MRGINKTAKQSSSDLTCIIECTTPIKRPLDTDNIPFICDKIGDEKTFCFLWIDNRDNRVIFL